MLWKRKDAKTQKRRQEDILVFLRVGLRVFEVPTPFGLVFGLTRVGSTKTHRILSLA
jgi:hypothetical protein